MGEVSEATFTPLSERLPRITLTPRRTIGMHYEIMRYTAEQACVRYLELRGPCRDSVAVWARHEAMLRLREYNPRWSYPRIARWFNDMDHTSVYSGIRRAKERRAQKLEPYMRPLTPEEIEMLKGVG